MKPAPEAARAAFAAIRPSIAARSPTFPARRPAPAACGGARVRAASCAAAVLLWGAAAVAQPPPLSQQPGLPSDAGTTNQIGAPEPTRPSVSIPYDSAIAAYRAGRADEALGIVERALRTDPRDPRLRFLRGVILAERGRADDALGVFRAMTQDFPELPEPYNNVAVILAARGDWDGARATIEQSIRAVPTYALAHENLGDIHLQLAARAYEQAGRLDARNASARGKLAMARELLARVQAMPSTAAAPRPGTPPAVTPPDASPDPRSDAAPRTLEIPETPRSGAQPQVTPR